MACVPRMLFLAVALATSVPLHAEVPSPLRYTIKPALVGGAMRAVDITLAMRAGDDGTIDLRIDGPVSAVQANVAVDRGTAGHIKLKAAPHAAAILRYRIEGNGDLTPERGPGPFMTQDWLNTPCPSLLALPDAWSPREIDLEWVLPSGWRAFSTLPAGKLAEWSSVGNAGCLMGRHVVETDTPISEGATLRLYTTDATATATMARNIARILRPLALAAGPAAVDFPVYTGVTATAGELFAAWSNGPFMSVVQERGGTGMALAAPLMANYRAMVHPSAPEPATAWYSTGMRAYLAMSEAVGPTGIGREDLATYLDQVIVEYGNSPLRRASNAQLVADWARVPQAKDTAMQRGLLFAWLLDGPLRRATAGKVSMASVLRGMEPAAADPSSALIAAVKAAGGGDVTALVDKYIVRGELLQLPPDALGACMTVRTDADIYGWQVQHVVPTCQR